ncbi:MAG TPA: LPS export ABC transporter periplasmic protein LptC [Candidatus Methylomirabilis sp.]|nr:LPS export ABC transporter periplasmic protein LptC [Candidatus Methylomirabilis sp.]
MRKLPILILGCVVLFLVAMAGLLAAKSRGAKSNGPEPAQSKADYRIKEVHLQEEDQGRGSWQLDADYGEVFENLGKTVMKKVTIRINDPARIWTVNSDEGEMMQETKDILLRGHVVVVSSDGLRLETDRLNWLAKEQRVWTDQPVTIWRNTMMVQGQGFESLSKEEITRVKGRLRATITPEPKDSAEATR